MGRAPGERTIFTPGPSMPVILAAQQNNRADQRLPSGFGFPSTFLYFP
jgi:hypothetical protein